MFRRTLAISLLGLLGATGPAAGAAPQFADVQRTVLQYFEAQSDYRPGDLITQSQADPLLTRIAAMGWPLGDRQGLLDRVSSDNGFLAKVLSTAEGKSFMRQVNKYPDAYDRLDRLAKMPYGQNSIQRLVHGPDGYKMLQYMTTASGGIELGKMLSRTATGANFNKPTGKIYTADDLISALQDGAAATR